MRSKLIRCMLLIGCALGSPALHASPAGAPAAAPVPSDTPSNTASGNTYLLPAGWSAAVHGDAVVLQPPETNLRLAIVDRITAPDAKAAAAIAWDKYRAGAVHPFKLATARPPRNGWDEQVVIDYETSPAEHLDQTAIARRAGTGWTVLILDGNDGTSEKRGGQIGQITASLRPAGYHRENFAGKAAHPLDPARVQQMVEFVRSGAQQLGVPGVGFALYSGGKIVYEGGVGVKELGKPDPIDAHTRFIIASNTKSMATLLLAELVSQGKLDWDEPVTKVYPSFRLGSDATTAKVRMRDLVCACTGLPRKDMEMLFNTNAQTPASSAFTLLAGTEPTSKFGEVFQYNNLMASAAGYIAGHVFYPGMEVGAAFDRAAQEHIYDPIGMHDTTLSLDAALAADHASPHGKTFDGVTKVESQDLNRTFTPFRPAGGAWSSPHDMILYTATELHEGVTPDGTRLASPEALLARRAHNIPIGEDQWYGMGLMDDRTWGVSVIHHGGDLAGYHSDMFVIPQAGVTAVILTNADDGVYLRRPFERRLLELLYDGKPEAVDDLSASAKRVAAELATERSKMTIPGDPKALASLAPSYANPDLGVLRIAQKGTETRLYTNSWNTALITRKNHDGTISIVASDPEMLGTDMELGMAAGKRTLTLRDGQHVYVFTETG